MARHGLRNVLRLALCDYWHESLLSLCAIMGLAAVLAPLLLLFGVKHGIIESLTHRLLSDPRNLELVVMGSGRYDASWFATLGADPRVAFILPQTRSLAATMSLLTPGQTGGPAVTVDLIPTADGDPLLRRWGLPTPGQGQVVLSWSAARKLGLGPGQDLVGRVGRMVAGQRQEARLGLKLAGVLPLEAQAQETAYAPLDLLEATEDYRDGFAVPDLGWEGAPRPESPRVYPSFRLYAKGLDEVAALRDTLLSRKLEVHTRAEEIEAVQSLDRAFTIIFGLLASVAVLGYFAATAANSLANVRRKMRHLGVARLLGFATGDLVWFPMIQAGATSVLGVGVALVLYAVAALVINQHFGPRVCPGEAVCRLSLSHGLVVLVLTLLASVLGAASAAWRVAGIEPSEVLRDV